MRGGANTKGITVGAPVAGINATRSRRAIRPEECEVLVNLVPHEDQTLHLRETLATAIFNRNPANGFDSASATYNILNVGPTAGKYKKVIKIPGATTTLEYWGEESLLVATHGRNLASLSATAVYDIVPTGVNNTLPDDPIAQIPILDDYLYPSFHDLYRVTVVCAGASLPVAVYAGSAASINVSAGLTTSARLFTGALQFKGRGYYYARSKKQFYYTQNTLAYQDSIDLFRLDQILGQEGVNGGVTSIQTYSRDGGDGPDDLFCIILSDGNVIIYQGDNPSDANAWAIVGKYRIGEPATNCPAEVARIGGKIAVVTKNDLEIIPDDLDRVGKVRSRFSTIVREKVRNASPGDVRLHYNDTKARLYIQLGQGEDDLYVAELGVPGAPVWQHKRGTGNRLGQSGVAIDASSNPQYIWNLDGGYVYTEPNVIVGELKQGWSDFGQDAMVNAYRVNLESDFSASVATAIAYDYQSANFSNVISVTTADPIDEWQAAGGTGRRARFEMVVSVSASATGEFSLTNVDYLITPGGIK